MESVRVVVTPDTEGDSLWRHGDPLTIENVRW